MERFHFLWKALTKLWTLYVKSQSSFISCFSLSIEQILNCDEMVCEEMIVVIKSTGGGFQVVKYCDTIPVD